MAAETPETSLLRKILPFPDLTALGLRDYRLWWIGSAATVLNQVGMQIILAWWVQTEFGSPARVGTMILFFGLPSFIFLLPAGLVADRWDRRKQLMAAQIAALLSASLLGILMILDVVSFPIAIVFAFISGTTVAFSNPARQALIPMMVPRRMLPNGIVLGSLSMNVSRLVAPLVAATIMAAIGVGEALFFVAAFLCVGVGTLSRMNIPHFPEDDLQPEAAGGGSAASAPGRGGPTRWRRIGCTRGGSSWPRWRQTKGISPAELDGGLPVSVRKQAIVRSHGSLYGHRPFHRRSHAGPDSRAHRPGMGTKRQGPWLCLYGPGSDWLHHRPLLDKDGRTAQQGWLVRLSHDGRWRLIFALLDFARISDRVGFLRHFRHRGVVLQQHESDDLAEQHPASLDGPGSLDLSALDCRPPANRRLHRWAGLVAEGIGAPLTGLIGGAIGVTLAAFALIFAGNYRRLT